MGEPCKYGWSMKLDELSFEDALEQLEKITYDLEQGQVSLDDAMKLYEKGNKLKDFCQKKLKEAEGKWKVLKKNSDGEIYEDEIDSGQVPDQDSLK